VHHKELFRLAQVNYSSGSRHGAKWVYTQKIDGETGKPSRYKARWAAKGYSQIEGVDFDELFAAVAHKDAIRLFLAIVNYYNWEMD
jgi:hypothetical protein